MSSKRTRTCSLLSNSFWLSVLALILVMFGGVPNTKAQAVVLGEDVSRPVPGVGHDYVGGLAETVDPSSGNLSIKIDLPVPKARGITLPYALMYSSGAVHNLRSNVTGEEVTDGVGGFNLPTERTQYGWTDTLPYVAVNTWTISVAPPSSSTNATCTYSSSYNFYDPAGGAHQLNLSAIGTVDQGSGEQTVPYECSEIQNYWTKQYGGDSQVTAQFLPGQCNGPASTGGPSCGVFAEPQFTVTDKSGTTYTFTSNYGPNNTPGTPGAFVRTYIYPSTVEDRNGNIVYIPQTSGSETDTLGRAVFGSLPALTPNLQSEPSSYPVTVGNLTYTITTTTTPAKYTPATPNPVGVTATLPSNVGCSLVTSVNDTPYPVMQSIGLPNGQAYTFKYDSTYGLVNEIDYPDGGWVKYTWGFPTNSSGNPVYSDVVSFDGVTSISVSPGVTDFALMFVNSDGPLSGVSGTGVPPAFSVADLGYCNYQYQRPMVLSRTVGYSGASPAGTTTAPAAQSQTFTYATQWDTSQEWWDSKTTTVVTKDNITSKYSETDYLYSSITQPFDPDHSANQLPAQLPVEKIVTYYDWSNSSTTRGPLLETVNKQWIDQFEMASEQTTLNNGMSEMTTYAYNGQYPGALLGKIEYDYSTSVPVPGKTSPSRSTSYKYFWLNQPSQMVVYNGNGTRVAETDVTYDGHSVAGVPGLAECTSTVTTNCTHDGINFAAATTSQLRGNPTTISKWLNNGNSAVTTLAFDETGQIVQSTDACGNGSCSDVNGFNHITNYSYKDSFASGGPSSGNTNAYLTQITDPLGFSQNFSYNFATGQLASATDASGNQTKYYYETGSTGLNRPTGVSYPDGGSSSTIYCDTDGACQTPSGDSVPVSSTVPGVITSVALSENTQRINVAQKDGMGHVIHTYLASDPNGADEVDTTYDGEGHALTVTNPYRTTLDATYGITSYVYDAFGRVIEKIAQDGSSKQWTCYNGIPSIVAQPNCNSQVGTRVGTWVDSQDENGNDWQKTSNGLGQLVRLAEPNGFAQAPSMQTNYSYDLLNNLLSVSQTGISGDLPRNRSFTYDSHSQLLTSNNPETGLVTYTYDANGNLQTKTDARGVKTSYLYNVVNQLLGKTYSNDLSGTPSSCYQYGTAGNAIERLTDVWTQSASAGACTTLTTYLTRRHIGSYDTMGRVLNEQQFTLASQAGGSIYAPAYTYDLAGNLLTSTDGITPSLTPGAQYSFGACLDSTPQSSSGPTLTFANCYDGAGHLQVVSSNQSGLTYPQPLLSSVPNTASPSYAAFGGLLNATFGTGLTASRGYDPRLRILKELDMGIGGQSATNGSATITITGAEQSK